MKIATSRTHHRHRILPRLGAVSQIAFVVAIFLSRFENPSLDFLEGMLLGFSISGNIAYLITLKNSEHQNNKGVFNNG